MVHGVYSSTAIQVPTQRELSIVLPTIDLQVANNTVTLAILQEISLPFS